MLWRAGLNQLNQWWLNWRSNCWSQHSSAASWLFLKNERNFALLVWLNLLHLQQFKCFCQAERPLGSSVQNLTSKLYFLCWAYHMLLFCSPWSHCRSCESALQSGGLWLLRDSQMPVGEFVLNIDRSEEKTENRINWSNGNNSYFKKVHSEKLNIEFKGCALSEAWKLLSPAASSVKSDLEWSSYI